MASCSRHPRTSVSAYLSSLIFLTPGTLRSTYRFLTSRTKKSPLKPFLVGRKTQSYRRTRHALDGSLKFFTSRPHFYRTQA